jgi:hypothetical protein
MTFGNTSLCGCYLLDRGPVGGKRMKPSLPDVRDPGEKPLPAHAS